MVYVLETLMGQQVERLWHKDTDLKGVDFIVLPGGFSYGDYLRSGAIAKLSPIMTEVIKHANNGGYVLGVCNGFQILTESGLLEGALLHNDNQRFICKNVYLKPETDSAPITKNLDQNKAYKIPIAHGEGRYYADAATIEKLKNNKKKILVYMIVSPILMVLFIVFSFLIFYNNNVDEISADINLIFYALLVGLFFCLAAMDYNLSKKIKENKWIFFFKLT